MDALKVGAEELEIGKFEVGVLIPREAVSNELKPFGKELLQLNKILVPFLELGTGERPDYEIRSISSSEFQLFLEAAGPAAACIAIAVERVVALYKQLLEIRIARKKLKEAGVSEKDLHGISTHADKHMETGIEKIAKEVLSEFGKHLDDGRKNELSVELKVSLTGIARRIDRGYNIEVRAGLPPPDEQEAEGEGDGGPGSPTRHNIEAVAAAQDGLKFMNLSGSPILSLPEPKRQMNQRILAASPGRPTQDSARFMSWPEKGGQPGGPVLAHAELTSAFFIGGS